MTICSRCIMDTTDPEITFDEQGVCNHCKRYDALSQTRLIAPEKRDEELATLIREIKQVGAGKPYDCVIGVSGGVDSTYVAWLVKEQGLRPLAVHLDNGWNSELATANIEKTLKTLDIDLYTHVIDWDSFNNLQLSFLYASTPDGEVPTDHAIFALLYRLAAKYNLRHVITGTNVASEAILPEKWGYGYFDLRYIRDVHKRFGTQKLVNYPCFTLKQLGYYVFGKKIRLVSILNYIEYRKSDAMDVLENRLGWIYYGGKHYESIYTRFYQAYILPRKFDIDKRKAHYSNLVLSGQMARQEALDAMQEPVYPESLLQEDREYVIKKFGLSNTAFNNIMNAACKTFENYANNRGLFNKAKSMVNAGRRYIG